MNQTGATSWFRGSPWDFTDLKLGDWLEGYGIISTFVEVEFLRLGWKFFMIAIHPQEAEEIDGPIHKRPE